MPSFQNNVLARCCCEHVLESEGCELNLNGAKRSLVRFSSNSRRTGAARAHEENFARTLQEGFCPAGLSRLFKRSRHPLIAFYTAKIVRHHAKR